MKADIRDAWVEALESGKYSQTQGVLRREDSFCCLGVLCDISGQGWVRDEDENYRTMAGNMGFLPYEFRQSINLDASDETYLSELNDFGKSFEDIASYIKENL